MVIDIHGHLGSINLAPFWRADAAKLEEYCEKSGVDTLCISSSRALMYDVHEGNMELDNALKNSSRLLGYVVASPVFPEAMDDLVLLKSNPKFRGVKVHPDYHGFVLSTASNRNWAEEVADQTPMMLFHVSCMPGTGFSPGKTVAEIAKNHPRTKFVLAHMGGIYQNGNYPYYPNMDALEEIAAMGLDNVYIDTAHFLMYVYPGVMEKMYKIVGADHIVFGTDAPLQGPMQMRFAIDTIEAMDIPEADKAKMLCKNAQKVLGL